MTDLDREAAKIAFDEMVNRLYGINSMLGVTVFSFTDEEGRRSNLDELHEYQLKGFEKELLELQHRIEMLREEIRLYHGPAIRKVIIDDNL